MLLCVQCKILGIQRLSSILHLLQEAVRQTVSKKGIRRENGSIRANAFPRQYQHQKFKGLQCPYLSLKTSLFKNNQKDHNQD